MGRTQPMPNLNAPSTKGKPLNAPLRHELESAHNRDFSKVRVHEGHEATHLGVNAFAHGTDIYFAPGQTPPPLVAHEAWHVVQQTVGNGEYQNSSEPPIAQNLVNLSYSSDGDSGGSSTSNYGGDNYGGNDNFYQN